MMFWVVGAAALAGWAFGRKKTATQEVELPSDPVQIIRNGDFIEFNLPNPPPPGSPSPRYQIGDWVKRDTGLQGIIITREYSDDHREWLYRLDCPQCPQGGIRESDLLRI